MLNNGKNKVILGKYKLKEGMLNLVTSKNESKLKLYKDFYSENISTLKRINATSTRANIEMKLNKKTFYPVFDWQIELVSLNNIFALTLGIIDARNDEYERNIEFIENFTNKEGIEEIKLKQEKLKEYRKMVLKDFESLFKRDDMEIIKETFNCNPSYKNFDNLFEDMKKNTYNLSIQGNLISAYMLGYNNSLYIYPEEILPHYTETINTYRLETAKNKCDCLKIKGI